MNIDATIGILQPLLSRIYTYVTHLLHMIDRGH